MFRAFEKEIPYYRGGVHGPACQPGGPDMVSMEELN